jgi:UDP-glucose 4-epimerase
MHIVVTGGAGYLGSVVVRLLQEMDYKVTVLDNLSRGFISTVPQGVRFIKSDVADLDKHLTKNDKVDAIVHLAAYAYVGESVQQPKMYWSNNVVQSVKLLQCMENLGIKKIVFASSCATYGVPKIMPITERTPTKPVNAYGMTKLSIDMALASEALAHGVAATSLRFFNLAGSYKDAGELHSPETHLIPNTLIAAAGNDKLRIFGTDYPTPDGTCIRDYIHVLDLAIAIEKSLHKTKHGEHAIYNLGTGNGLSNKQIVDSVRSVTGREFAVNYEDRRPGDPPRLVASNDLAKKELGWEPKHSTLDEMIGSAWHFYQTTLPKLVTA